MQKLIMPVNQATISASFKNENYKNRFGFEHYGVDMYGSIAIYSPGNGIVLSTGTDAMYGNYVTAYFPYCWPTDLPFIFNFFHLSKISVGKGVVLDKDVVLGLMGQTGTYATGVHLHTEAYYMDYPTKKNFSPFPSKRFHKLPVERMVNPLSILFTKTSAPDNQSIKFTQDDYCNQEDMDRDYTLKED